MTVDRLGSFKGGITKERRGYIEEPPRGKFSVRLSGNPAIFRVLTIVIVMHGWRSILVDLAGLGQYSPLVEFT